MNPSQPSSWSQPVTAEMAETSTAQPATLTMAKLWRSCGERRPGGEALIHSRWCPQLLELSHV